MSRKLEGPISRNNASGMEFLDEMNPRLLSNNLLVPYMIAVWEEFFRATFTACLKYSDQREAALKRARLTHTDLERIVIGSVQIEQSVAEVFSFQRPSVITRNFKLLDPKLDLAAPMRNLFDAEKSVSTTR